MTNSLEPIKEFVGVDVSQDRLDVYLLPGGERAEFSRDRRGIARLVAWLASRERLLVVVEATGGLERTLTVALAQAALAVAVVNPRQIRDFARAAGLLAKTDRLDAYALALYGERLRPVPRPPRSAADHALAALVLRRRQLAQLVEAEHNRARRTDEPAVLRVDRGAPELARARRSRELEGAIDARLEASPVWRERAALLATVPGVGKVTVATLLASAAGARPARPPGHRRAGRGRPVRPRQRPDEGPAHDLGRPSAGPRGALHGGPGRGPPQPRAPRLLPAPGRGRQSQEARAHRRHAQAPGHPQRHAQGPPTMARTTISLTSKTVADSVPSCLVNVLPVGDNLPT